MNQIRQPSALFPLLEDHKRFCFPILLGLSVLSVIYLQLVKVKFLFFRKKWAKSTTLSLPVLSVGNLTVGGTGKTPVIIYLVNILKRNDVRVGIVSRNYKSSSNKILKVQPSASSSSTLTDGQTFGDEPMLIFEKTQSPVYVGPVKVETAKELVRNEKVDVICIDDGFQHLKLRRNCNILLLDVTQMDGKNYLLPRGRYREPLEGYKKADIIFWTKTNFVSAETLESLKKQVSFGGFQVDWAFELASIDFPEFATLNFNFNQSTHFPDRQEFSTIRRFVLVSAIARPEFFKKMILDLNSKNEIVEKTFSDHHQYSTGDLKTIMDKPLNFKHFLTTEKDYTKLKDLWPKDVPLGIVKWNLRPNKSDQQIYETISTFLH